MKKRNSSPMRGLAILATIAIIVVFLTPVVRSIMSNQKIQTLSETSENWAKTGLTGLHNRLKTFDVYCSKKIKASADSRFVQLSIFRSYTEHGKEIFYRYSPGSKNGIIVTEMILLVNTKDNLIKTLEIRDRFSDNTVEAREVDEDWQPAKKGSREYGYIKLANKLIASK